MVLSNAERGNVNISNNNNNNNNNNYYNNYNNNDDDDNFFFKQITKLNALLRRLWLTGL